VRLISDVEGYCKCVPSVQRPPKGASSVCAPFRRKVEPRDLATSERLKKQSHEGTKPEVLLGAELERRGFTVTRNVRELPGCPDIVLSTRRLAVFVHGCFWHGCPSHFTVPRHNRRWWLTKIEGNRARDRRKADRLRRLGWSVVTIWEHDPPTRAADRIQRIARLLGRRRSSLGYQLTNQRHQ